MSKAVKQLIVVLVLICGLGAVYFIFGDSEEGEGQAEVAAPPVMQSVRLIDRSESEIEEVVFFPKGEGEDYFRIRAEVSELDGSVIWLSDIGEVSLNQQLVSGIMRDIFMLDAADMILEEVESASDFGIGQVRIDATFSDGVSHTINLGGMTPERNYFYVMVDDDSALYLINVTVGNRLSSVLKDLVDRTLPFVDTMQLTYLYLSERGRPTIEAYLNMEAPEPDSVAAQFGGLPLVMAQPYAGRDFHFSSFEYLALESFEGFEPSEVVELFPSDYSVYGFDEPLLTFIMTDTSNFFYVEVGDAHDDEYFYMMYGDRAHVFLVNRRYIDGLLGLNPFNFIDRFVALMSIVAVERIKVESASRGSYELIINNYTGEDGREAIAPVVNGQEVEDRAFRNLYQQLIGLSFENEIEVNEEPGEPDVRITYHMVDDEESSVVVELFVYDANFYAVRQYPNSVQFVTSRMAVDLLFDSLVNVTNE